MARPIKHKLDESLLVKLARDGNSMEDIAAICGCSVDTLERRYAEVIKVGRAQLRRDVRAAQVEVAVQQKNPQMLVWLGKQLLGQKDRTDMTTDDQPITIKNLHGVTMDDV